MQRIYKLIVLLLVIANTGAFAQASKQVAEEVMVDGVKLIFKPSLNKIVSARMFIRGGVSNYQKAQEGIEALALQVATTGGTQQYSKEKYFEELEKVGASIAGTSTFDFGNVSLSCVNSTFDKVWPLFADAIMNPSFTEEEFSKIKEQSISTIKENQSNPDAYIQQMIMLDAFANLDYSKRPAGTEESMEKFTAAEARDYLKSVINKKQVFFVVVGNVNKADLIEKVRAMVKGMPEGKYVANSSGLLNITQSTVNIEERPLATNYIFGVMNAPVGMSEEGYAMRLAYSIFSNRMFDEIRTKRGLSYAPYAMYRGGKSPYAGMGVSTTDPNASVQVMIDEVKKLKTVGFSEKEVLDEKSGFVTSYFMQQETNAGQTQSLGSNEIYGSWQNSITIVDKINNVKAKQVNDAFKKYATGIRWSYLGDKSKLDSKLMLQKL